MKQPKNVFIIGYEPFNLKLLQELPISKDVQFHSLLTRKEMQGNEEVPALELLNLAIKRIEESPIEPDAIITYWDFPGTLLNAILNSRYGLNGPNPRSVFKCEHKAWSRAEQKKVIANHLPIAVPFDPDDVTAYEKINLLPPFWIKPVKSFRSWLSFKVTGRNDFEEFRKIMKDHVNGIYEPFVKLMQKSRIPEAIASSTESCIAESSLEGLMCTVEGYVYDGDTIVYGIIDSVREKDSNSFQRYQYPSQLPMDVQFRMAEITRKAIDQIDLNDACFNIEYFYNQTLNSIHLLEINPRTSQSHSDLFAKVHGYSQFQILLEIALNRRPGPMKREGQFRMACKYMHRVNHSGVVKRIPSEEEITDIVREFPGTKIKLLVSEGDNLDNLLFQDAYSFEIADIYIGGYDEVDIDQKYHAIVDRLGIIIERDLKNPTTAADSSRIMELTSQSH